MAGNSLELLRGECGSHGSPIESKTRQNERKIVYTHGLGERSWRDRERDF